jgi:RHS repeat-associated protein
VVDSACGVVCRYEGVYPATGGNPSRYIAAGFHPARNQRDTEKRAKNVQYGKILDASENVDPRYKFTGQALEKDISTSSFWNFRARMYDSDVALFYAADPAHETYSRYGYCAGNPINFVDPTGRMKAPTRYEQSMAGIINNGGMNPYDNGNTSGNWDRYEPGLGSSAFYGFGMFGPDFSQVEAENRIRYEILRAQTETVTAAENAQIAAQTAAMDAQIMGSSVASLGSIGLQPMEGTTVFFFDSKTAYYPTRSADLQATVYVMVDGKLVGTYRGSTYPSQPYFSTVEEGPHWFDNASGRSGRAGLNIRDDVDPSYVTDRTTYGSHPSAPGERVHMTEVDVHSFEGGPIASKGCLTILKSDWSSFASHFDWNGGVTGNSYGTIYVFRNKTASVAGRR